MRLSNEQADKYLDEILENIVITLKEKAKEYVRNDDRMHNFNKAADKRGISREEAIDGMRLKHEISIDDIREDIKQCRLPSKSIVKEKFGDMINYYILEYMSVLNKIDSLDENN